jgi:hypothetical protein
MTSLGAIRSLDLYAKAAARRRTERFNDCFPRGISLGDLDSFVEINRHFLMIEWKVGDQQLGHGQSLAFNRLAHQPHTSVWVLWTTEDGFITHGQRLGFHASRVAVDEETVKQRLKDWASSADKASCLGRISDSAIADRLEALIEIEAIRTKALLLLIADLRGRD